MQLNRKITSLKSMHDADDDFVCASMEERILMVWEITRELWGFSGSGENDVEQRLQRNVVCLKKMQR